MAFIPPKPSSYWDPPDLVSFEQQLENTPADLSPVDDPKMPASTPPIAKQVILNNGGRDVGSNTGKSMDRDMTNNFGYIDKPGIVGMAGMLPGPLGLAGKAINLGINANNQQAVSGARKTLGLPDQTGWQQAKGLMKDNQGIVSNNVSINEHNYPVGFEAMTPDNRTTLTPNEARTRALTLGGMTETPAPEKSHSGVISGIFDEASSFFDSIFNDDVKPTEHVDVNSGLSLAERMGKYPSAPAARGGLAQTDPRTTPGPWGAAGNTTAGQGKTGYGHEGTSGQSVGPSGGGKSWGGPH